MPGTKSLRVERAGHTLIEGAFMDHDPATEADFSAAAVAIGEILKGKTDGS